MKIGRNDFLGSRFMRRATYVPRQHVPRWPQRSPGPFAFWIVNDLRAIQQRAGSLRCRLDQPELGEFFLHGADRIPNLTNRGSNVLNTDAPVLCTMFEVATADVTTIRRYWLGQGQWRSSISGRNAPTGHSFDVGLSVPERGIWCGPCEAHIDYA
jgi:hypothetical protein